MDKKKQVIMNLEKYGITTDIDSKTIKYLCKIQEIMNSADKKKDSAIYQLKENTLSISEIAQRIGVVRQTLYNNKVVFSYISFYFDDVGKKDIILINKDLKEQLDENDSIIKSMIKMDAELAVYKEKVKILEEQISSLKNGLEAEIKRNQLLRKNYYKGED